VQSAPTGQMMRRRLQKGSQWHNLHDIDMSLFNHKVDKSVTKVSVLLLRLPSFP
jgi:hypothetical protein